MKRTISEIIELIKQKKEGAMDYLAHTTKTYVKAKMIGANCEEYVKDGAKITGYIEAYKDVLSLLESSHLVEQEKAIDILKNKFIIKLEECNWNSTIYYISFCGKEDYERTGGIDCIADEKITEEQYDILNEVLRDNE